MPNATVIVCGANSRQGLAHGCGCGLTAEAAFAAAVAEATVWARAAASNWIAMQECPDGCRIKRGEVHIPPQSGDNTPPDVVSQDLFEKRPGPPGPGTIVFPGGGDIYRLCVVIAYEVVLHCERAQDVRRDVLEAL